MKLSDLYTTGTVARSVGSFAPVCTRKIDEMYPETGMEFDTSILMCNGSTSEMLNKGAYGSNFTAYTANGSLQNGETTSPINFLGCVIIRDWDGNNPLNLTRKIISKGDIYDATWDDVKNLRFVTNVVSSEGISESNYKSFDITTTSNIIYDFNSTYVEPNFSYSKQNTFLTKTGFVNNPLSLTDDNAKRIFGAQFTVNASIYNKYMPDSYNIDKNKIGDLGFIYLINNEYFLLKSPISMPDSGYDHKTFTIDNVKNYLTIGGFSDFENGNTGFLPQNDETKGAYPYTQTASGSYKQACNYYVTANCALYVLNSCGLRWVLTSNITTAKNFRDNVRLGVMDKNGIINHKEWIIGESAIQASDNPNKDTSYDNIPDRPTPGGGDDDDNSDDINFGYAFSGAGAFTNLWYCTQQDLTNLRQWFLGADAEHPIPEGFDPMPSIIGLFQYPISLGGDVLEEIKFRTSSGLIVSTGVQAARGLSTNLKFDLGSINIPARMRERGVPFLDYESTVECYVPFCGVFQLDTQTVIGKTLSCTLWMSPATGECNCIVYTISNGIKAPVAYGSGNMSSQIPISSNGWGSYAAALKNATIQKN